MPLSFHFTDEKTEAQSCLVVHEKLLSSTDMSPHNMETKYLLSTLFMLSKVVNL